MSQLFNRITRDVSKFGGQAFIQNTDVTVNEIVFKSTNGDSLQEILDAYPQLKPEDVHQALSFAVHDMVQGIAYWRHDGITPLTQIKGYSEILVGKTKFDDLDTIPDQQKLQWLSVIHSSSQRGIACWQQMKHWISHQYLNQLTLEMEIYELDNLIMEIATIAKSYEPSLEIDIASLNPRVAVEVDNDTSLILGSILAFAKNTFTPNVFITFDLTQSHVKIQFGRHLQYPDDDMEKLFTAPYNPISTALTFFYAQNIPFDIIQAEEKIVYTVEFPTIDS